MDDDQREPMLSPVPAGRLCRRACGPPVPLIGPQHPGQVRQAGAAALSRFGCGDVRESQLGDGGGELPGEPGTLHYRSEILELPTLVEANATRAATASMANRVAADSPASPIARAATERATCVRSCGAARKRQPAQPCERTHRRRRSGADDHTSMSPGTAASIWRRRPAQSRLRGIG